MANFAWFSKFHRFVYHYSRGWVGSNLAGNPMMLMYTIGARSGAIRTIPMLYHPIDKDGVIILGSNNGQKKPPAWFYNIKANPEFSVLVGRERRRVRAEEVVSQTRRAELWPQMVARHARVEAHARHAGRELPIFLLRTLEVAQSRTQS